MNSRVILNADDLGLRDSINRGVRDLLSRGLLSSATIMVKHDPAALDEAVRIAHDFAPAAGFGLHLDLDEFFPFDATGHYGLNEHDVPDGFSEILHSRSRDIHDDIRRQFDRLLKAGVYITHVDGHHNAHLFPEIFEMLKEAAIEFGITATRFCEPFFQSDETRQKVHSLMGEAGVNGTDHFYDLSQLMHEGALSHLPDGISEIMVHADAPDSHEQWRVGQYHFLLEHEGEIRGLQLTNFGEI